ncbi:hypothetical protein [Enterococcus faecalis]|nr:hypothetical protein [Enterococcus faecalis]
MGNIYLKIFKRKVQIVENFYIFKNNLSNDIYMYKCITALYNQSY